MDLEYIVVQRTHVFDLVKEVNERIEEGYKPLGGVCVTSTGLYIQALMKEHTVLEDST